MIFYVSGMSNLSTPDVMPQADKVFHGIMYFPFGFLALRALVATFQEFKYSHLMLGALVLTVLYGLSDEFHQMFVGGRTSSIWDWAADVFGGILGIFAFRFIFLQSRKT